MIYLGNPCTDRIRQVMATGGQLGCMATPAQGNDVPAGSWWAADNGVFGKGYPGPEAWLQWLAGLPVDRERCLFACAPDVVGDAAATLHAALPWLQEVRDLGYPVAYVAQDGIEDTGAPWDDFDCLFLGGTTEFKLGPVAREYANLARAHGKWVHMGRVNSWKRWQVAEAFGCDSADGTYLTFAPDRWLPDVLGWTAQSSLF